ncbi:MAG: SDR family oxidoreductase [Pseudonocardiaceae bacterium]|nr:SDR family oxidoreductase [Pseudonocardiaceae bacterium]
MGSDVTKWAVVTGAGNGIGAVIARHAVKEGYTVAAWDVDAEGVKAVAADLGEACVPAVVDVTDEAAVESGLDALPQAPELLVNNAGIVRFGPLLDLPLEDWEQALRVNLTGTFLVSRTAARRMAAADGGCIVNLASVNGLAAAPRAGAYSSGKAGIVMLTEQMAMEWASHGIRVNAVAPGLIHAGMSDAIYADEEVRRVRQGRVPLGRLGSADDIANAVLFLGSDKAGYVTGQTLAVDGGLIKSTLASLPRPKSVDSVGTD